jgi:hypothetical protein
MGLITQLAAVGGSRTHETNPNMATPHAFLLTQAELIGRDSGSTPGTYDCAQEINEETPAMTSR